MKIVRAEHLGMCFGVRNAIALAKKTAAEAPLTVFGELVHNETVLQDLEAHGIHIESELSRLNTATVMITAHGASQAMIDQVRECGHEVIEATCPLVRHAHQQLLQLVKQGFHPVVIGKRGHVEVRGLTEDLEAFDVVHQPVDVANLAEHSRFGIVSQTTQPIAWVRLIVDLIRQRFPSSDVRFVDTVCQPTKQRQQAAEELARQVDVLLVIGSATSNNTRELVKTTSRFCPVVHHVHDALDIREEWFTTAHRVGITAGTSTPDEVIDGVESAVRLIAARCSPAKAA